MYWFHGVMLGCAAIVWLLVLAFNRSKRFNAPSMYLEPTPNGVVVRRYPIERILARKGQLVAVDSVNKVQLSRGTISIFKQSGAAYDMWVPSRFERDLFAHAERVFPNAELVRV